MKILMFGWEFPPHISGGLGTACFGLTTSLGKMKNKIIFVVPNAHGDESVENSTFIGAASVRPAATGPVTGRGRLSPSDHIITRQPRASMSQVEGSLEIHKVRCALSPYQASGYRGDTARIRNWYSGFPQELNAMDGTPPNANVDIEKKEPGEPSASYGQNLFTDVQTYAKAGEELGRRNTFDIIHAHDWMTFLAGIAAKKVSGKPLIVHVHSTEYDRAGENVDPLIYRIEKSGMEKADCIVAVSNWTKEIIVKGYHIDPEKVRVVHNGIVEKTDLPVAPAPAAKFGSHTVTFLGRITHQKGPLLFVEAAKQVLAKFPDAHFVVAGSGDLMPAMVGLVANLGLSSHFHFTGFLGAKEVKSLWSISNVYVMPSVSEPFGIAPLEAIQAGVPVIISNQSGVSEVMPDAIKVDYWDSYELASAICSVLKYKGLSKTLVRQSAKTLESITWDRAAEKLTKLYNEFTQKQKSQRQSRSVSRAPSAKIIEQIEIS
jgi:glycosyltransferase involved in cell wall biosynthesis